ncbi:hypothetical protein Tco_0541300 [Tanacetum coccineum]
MGIQTIGQTGELLPLPPLSSIWKDLRLLVQKSCEHFGWDSDSPGTEVDWQDDPLHETEDFFVGLDQPIQLVVAQNNVHEGVAEELIEMANDQAKALSSDKEVTDECLDDEHVGESRPSKRIRFTQEEMVNDEKSKKS